MLLAIVQWVGMIHCCVEYCPARDNDLHTRKSVLMLIATEPEFADRG